jgi:uncharacterized membrane protein YsdA (DUF1294 family)/cold shock CspA family protein
MESGRVDGLLVSWNDDRGFGFLRPADGSSNVFVHISSFGRMAGRPQVGDIVSYRPGRGKDGRPQALDVHGPGRVAQQTSRAGAGGIIALALFLVAFVVIGVIRPFPLIVAGIYLVAGAITFATYAYDKRQARSGGWRVPEATLLLQGLLGGWPGAIIAQLAFHHKTIKSSFRVAFWATVVVNVVVFVALTIAVAWGR